MTKNKFFERILYYICHLLILLLIYISSTLCNLHYLIYNFIDKDLMISKSCFSEKIDFSLKYRSGHIESTTLPPTLLVQRYRRVWAATQTRGISLSPSSWNSRRRRPAAVTEGSCCLTAASRLLPTSSVLTQLKKQCSRSPTVGVGQYLHISEELGRILANLCSVGSRRCKSFHRKLVASDPDPSTLLFSSLIPSQSLTQWFN